LLVYEPFAYADGWLTGQGGALGTTGTWTAYQTALNIDPDGTAGPLPPVANVTDWRIHQEGDTTGIVVAPGPPILYNTFDGTVANLPTLGGYVGLPGPEDIGLPPDVDVEIGRYMDASIALDPSVTASFQTGSTTWFSYVAVQGWDRNMEPPQLQIGTDPSPNDSRNTLYNLTNSGSGIGAGGGPPRNDRFSIMPRYHIGGANYNLMGAATGWTADAFTAPADAKLPWVGSDDDGFGAANIIVGKIEWDADTGGEDIISVVRFLEPNELSEAAFDAIITAQPNLSSANWASNKPNLDQSQFDTINLAGTKFFVDEIRIGTTFIDATSGISDPNLPSVNAGINMITWSGEPVALDSTVVNNDTNEPQGTLTYLWTASPDGIGDPNLDVAITDADQEDASVTITKTATGDATVVTMTLAVTLEGKDPVKDSMTIDVYDDACLAALDLGLAVIDPTDLDENCITNFADFAVLAATWLDDYALTGPVAK
jgi:hypothetical protein